MTEPEQPPANSVRIRMYRQGLGDCFLLSFDVEGSSRHVLIDCGVLQGSPDAAARMRAVAANIRDTTGGHLDALVATHEHWDHLSGFLQAEEIFAGLTVGAVWLAWTEDPDDALADSLRTDRRRSLRAVVEAATALRAAGSDTGNRLWSLLDFYGDLSLYDVPGLGAGGLGMDGLGIGGLAVDGRPTTAKALAWVQDRQAAPRYLQPGAAFDALGVRVYVLGPPRDPVLIRRSDPSSVHSEVYEITEAVAGQGFLAAAEAAATDVEPWMQPFDPYFRQDEAALAASEVGAGYLADEAGWRRIDTDWLGAAGPLALKLDSDTNNTSLVLAFELGDGAVLLFPGDAQVGNWLSWESLEWSGHAGPIHVGDLLTRTVVYKVGHHGSHNATLRDKGLELMSSTDLVAMIPVNRATAAKQRWNMPLPGLFDRLQEKTKGRILDAELGISDAKPSALTDEQWASFLACTDVQDLWVDYTRRW